MNKILFTSLAVLLLIVGAYFFVTSISFDRDSIQMDSNTEVVTGEKNSVVSSFKWSYKEHEGKEIPDTTISLTAVYADGTSKVKEIDTIEGGCNEFAEKDADVVEDSSMIICYYAGLGHYFKVIETAQAYEVQRKIFEEGSPEYEPPQLPFETVASFVK